MDQNPGSGEDFFHALRPERITIDHRDVLTHHFQSQRTIVSELSFEGLFLFSEYYNYTICNIQDKFCFGGIDKAGRFIISPFGTIDNNTLHDIFKNDIYVKLVTQTQYLKYSKAIKYNKSNIFSYRDDYDYIFKRLDLEELSGRKYHKKRNNIAQFLGLYNNIRVEQMRKENLKDIMHITNVWEGEKKEDNNGKDDYTSVVKMIEYFDRLNLFGRIYYIDDEPAAFVVGEMRLKNKCCIIFFQKAQKKFKGIYQYINREFISNLPPECILINLEQDLGIEGLRQAKETYRPSAFLKKYRIIKND